jgi:hypothetical protein
MAGLAPDPAAAAWILQGDPYPVIDLVSSRVTVGLKKIGCITTFSREMADYSTPAAEQITRVAISESLALALDARMFSTTAADSTSPPGLFAGISALTASTASIASEAMAEDLSQVIAAVAAVSGNNPIVVIASPRQAAAIRVRTDVDFETFASSAMPDKSIAAVATNSLFSVGDSSPRFDTSLASSLHMDSSPGQLGVVGTPNTISAPTRSVWQTDCLALKMQFSINWALRNSAGVAWINNTTAW